MRRLDHDGHRRSGTSRSSCPTASGAGSWAPSWPRPWPRRCSASLVNGVHRPGPDDTDLVQALIAIPGRGDRPGVSYWWGAPRGPRARHRPRLHPRRLALSLRSPPDRRRRPARSVRSSSQRMARMDEPDRHVGCRPYEVASRGRRWRPGSACRRPSAPSSRGAASATRGRTRASSRAEERHDPLSLPGVPPARELILDHLRRGSRIAVFGDYDVDGVCSTAMLVRTLRALGGDPLWELPSRFDDGYGLSAAAVERLAARGAGLLVTVDCGITRGRRGGGGAGRRNGRGGHRSPPARGACCRTASSCTRRWAATAAPSCAPPGSR